MCSTNRPISSSTADNSATLVEEPSLLQLSQVSCDEFGIADSDLGTCDDRAFLRAVDPNTLRLGVLSARLLDKDLHMTDIMHYALIDIIWMNGVSRGSRNPNDLDSRSFWSFLMRISLECVC